MNYEQALTFIHSCKRFKAQPELETSKELMARLGSPHQKLKFVHVAGTNGKGSTSSFIAAGLQEAGHKVGLFVSPFVDRFTERIQINGQKIGRDALAKHAAAVARVCDANFNPTEFEVVTAIGMLYFLEQQCDYVVLEVGLGGRFDVTNVIPPPQMSVITGIGIDHTAQLGNTLEQIAFEKSGIIKAGSKLALYPDNLPEAENVMLETAAKLQVPVYKIDKSQIQITKQDISSTRFLLGGTEYEIKMLGTHQVYNAATAVTALENLGIGITTDQIRQGLNKVKFGGRLEIIKKRPLVAIDGAHNHSGALTLRQAMDTYFNGRKIHLVMGMLRDKEYKKCIKTVAPAAYDIIATQPGSPRALPAKEFAEIAAQYCSRVQAVPDRDEAVRQAISAAQPDDVVCICGSLFLIGGVRDLIN